MVVKEIATRDNLPGGGGHESTLERQSDGKNLKLSRLSDANEERLSIFSLSRLTCIFVSVCLYTCISPCPDK